MCLDVGIKSSPIVFPTNSLKSNFNLKSDIFKTGPKLLNLLKIAQSVHTGVKDLLSRSNRPPSYAPTIVTCSVVVRRTANVATLNGYVF